MPVQTEIFSDVQMMAGEIIGETADGAQLEFDQMDNKIITATLKAFESGSLTPLIKEELRCTIQSRRLAEGKGELKVEFKKPVKKKDMTDEERKRSLKRRQQNREAAQRFRQKQKDTSDYLSAKIKRLERSSHSLIDDLKRLREEKELLKQMLDNHLLVCTNPTIECPSPLQYHKGSNSNDNSISIDSIDINSLLSSCSSMTDGHSVLTDRTPDTATSDSSVFFADDDPNFTDLEPMAVPDFGCNNVDATTVVAAAAAAAEVPTTTAEGDGVVLYDGRYLDVGYEETVVNIDDTDSEFDEERRPDSCSSNDALVCKADWGSCLSQSMHSVTTAYSRAHLDSCSSQTFEPMPDGYFFMEDVTP